MQLVTSLRKTNVKKEGKSYAVKGRHRCMEKIHKTKGTPHHAHYFLHTHTRIAHGNTHTHTRIAHSKIFGREIKIYRSKRNAPCP